MIFPYLVEFEARTSWRGSYPSPGGYGTTCKRTVTARQLSIFSSAAVLSVSCQCHSILPSSIHQLNKPTPDHISRPGISFIFAFSGLVQMTVRREEVRPSIKTAGGVGGGGFFCEGITGLDEFQGFEGGKLFVALA